MKRARKTSGSKAYSKAKSTPKKGSGKKAYSRKGSGSLTTYNVQTPSGRMVIPARGVASARRAGALKSGNNSTKSSKRQTGR